MVDETDGRADVTPRNLNELDDVDGEPTEGSGLQYVNGAWRPGLGGFPSNGLKANFYNGDSDEPNVAHDTGFFPTLEPVLDNASWEPFGSITAENVDEAFGEMFESGQNVWSWRPTEPGIYVVQADLQIELSGTANIATRMGVMVQTTPFLNYAGKYRKLDSMNSGTTLQGHDRDIMYAPQEAIDAGKAFAEFSAIWRRGASETCTNIEWYFNIYQLSPGADFNTWPLMS